MPEGEGSAQPRSAASSLNPYILAILISHIQLLKSATDGMIRIGRRDLERSF